MLVVKFLWPQVFTQTPAIKKSAGKLFCYICPICHDRQSHKNKIAIDIIVTVYWTDNFTDLSDFHPGLPVVQNRSSSRPKSTILDFLKMYIIEILSEKKLFKKRNETEKRIDKEDFY